MADDAIFPTETPKPAPAAPGPTAEQLTQQLAQGIQQAIAPLHREVQQLRQQVEQPKPGPEVKSQAQPTHAGTLDRLIEQPERVIAEEAWKSIGPYIAESRKDQQAVALDRERQRVVARFGEKAWNEVVKPRYEAELSTLSDAQRINIGSQSIKQYVNNVLGDESVADTLEGYRRETAEQVAKAAKEREVPADFVGRPGRGFQRSDMGDVVTPEDKAFIDKLNSHGIRFSEKDYVEGRKARQQFGGDMEARFDAELAARQAARGR